ncbi:MAG: carboxylesterase family protein [Bacteroidia bacterium]|nr:carboxylesterase family protein [Bacteroidia bacterium]
MKQASLLLLLALLGSTPAWSQLQTGSRIAVAQTDAGQVRGCISGGIYTYKGIPYAEAGRFEAPRKPKPWDGVRSSMTYGPVAPLLDPTTSVQDESEFVFNHSWGYTSEDCMRLNVWSPGIADGRKRPVLFWIHGGGFTAGSSQELPSYDGENLARTGDVVVVSINHRLNILGYLDLSAYGEKYRYSANLSILDMRAALEWVQANIANFGGDPGNVTIFGQSGGGAKVNMLMAMPSARGLFHKAINQSGSFRVTMPDKQLTQAIGAEVLKELGIAPAEADRIQTVPFAELSAAGKRALATVAERMKAEGKPLPGFGLSWGPSRDGDLLPYDAGSPEALALSKDIPLLIGTVKNEFMASLYAGMTDASEADVQAFLSKRYGDKTDAYVAAVKKAYPRDTRPSDLMDVDLLFRPGAVAQADAKAALAGGAPVYLYMFTWQSPVMDGKYKATHCMELPFVFNNIARCQEMTGGGKDAYKLAAKVSAAWVRFARTGNPAHKGLPAWPAYTASNGANMIFDHTCEVRSHFDRELLDLMK